MTKRTTLAVLMVLIASTFAFADEWISFEGKGEGSPEYDIMQSNDSYVEFELEIPGMKSKDVESYNRLYVPEHTKMDSVGYPEVPFVSYLIAIPECNSVDLNVTVLDSVVIDSMNVYPAPEWVEHSDGDDSYMEEVFTLNAAAYGTDVYFPGYMGALTGKGAVRAQHCIRVNIYPVQFNPVQQEVIAYSRVNIEMSFNGVSGSINEDVGIFNEVCGASMINYDSNGLNASISCGAGYENPGKIKWLEDLDSLCMGEQGVWCDYLIITHDSFWVNPYIDSLAQKRSNYNGFDVVIVKLGDIVNQVSGEDYSERMRNLIRDTYFDGHADHTYDDRIGYVSLFGDAYFGDDPTDDCVPTYPYQNFPDTLGYDNYFARLTGIGNDYDIYPDILIGRCPVDDEEQVRNVCRKIINYEPIPDTTSWLNKMTFVNTADAYDAHKGFEIILPMVEDYDCKLFSYERYYDDTWNPPEELQQYFDRSWDATMPRSKIESEYENGSFMISYMGHGSLWQLIPDSTSQFFTYDAINNSCYNGRLPFISSMSCATGFFQKRDTCMAERFLVCNDKRGAIGFIAASVNATWQSFYDFAPWVFESAFRYNLGMCGEMLFEGKLKTIYNEHLDMYNLIGDPALNILLNSDNIGECDLQCTHQGIAVENLNNQTLQIDAGVSNYSYVHVTNFDVICYLEDTAVGTVDSIIHTISGIDAMETMSVEFNFDVSSSLPAEYTIRVQVDPDSVIAERNENNNEGEISYDYFKYQDGFPVLYREPINSIEKDIPLYYNNDIIITNCRISESGDKIWENSSNYTCGPRLPIDNSSTDDFDYIAKEMLFLWLFKVSGSDGSTLFYYDSGIYEPMRYGLGDINNDGIMELICCCGTLTDERFIIFDLDGNILYQGLDNFKNLNFAIGDADNDGKNELYISGESSSVPKLTSYEFENGTLNQIHQKNLSYPATDMILNDFSGDGFLDIAVFTTQKVYFLDCASLGELFVTDLAGSYINASIGDINNEGNTNFLVLESQENSDSIMVHRIDVMDNNYSYLFGFSGIEPTEATNLTLYDLNTDNILDFILSGSCIGSDYNEKIVGYTLGGDLQFSFPAEYSKSSNILFDIDNDNDIDLIFGKDSKDYTSKYELIVSDLDIAPGNHGSLYSHMNVYNNSLYSQPVIDTLDNGTTYYWDGSITLHGDVILPDSNELHIQPGTVIKAREDSRLIINGNLIAEGTEENPIVFEPAIYDAPSSYWYGLEIYSPGSVTIAHCRINNAGDTIICVHNNAELVITDNLNLNGKISVSAGGELSIDDNSIVTCMNSDTSIEVEGAISLGDSVTFTSPESVRWDGLYFYNTNNSIEIDGLTFEHSTIENKADSLTISNSAFNNATLEQYGNKLFLSSVDFDTSNVYCYYTGSGSKVGDPDDVEVNISSCSFTNYTGYPLYICEYDLYDISDNTISHCNQCIYLYECGHPVLCNIADNVFENNNSVGIRIYHSYADIVGNNVIRENSYGIVAANNSSLSMIGNTSNPLQMVYDNTNEELLTDEGSYPEDIRYNKIYDDDFQNGTSDQYLIRCANFQGDERELVAEDNYWGSASLNWDEWDGDDRFSPSNAFDYIPVWDPGQASKDGDTEAHLLYVEADSLIKKGLYKDAKAIYRGIIDLYTSTEYALYSMRNLLPMEQITGQDFSSLRDYYLTDSKCNITEERTKLSQYLANWCTIELRDYPTAISFFEDIISNPDTELDSVYAVIDAGYTYLLMENSGKSGYVGKMPELKPESREAFFSTSDKLISELFGLLEEENNEEPETEYAFELRYNYPNPFRGSTKISFSLPASVQKADLKIYNIRGQLVRKLDIDNTPGIRSISWDGFDTYGKKVGSGIYFYRLTADKKETIKKMVIIR